MSKEEATPDQLYKEFKPLILQYAKSTHKKIGYLMEYEDIFQTLCLAFSDCLARYKTRDKFKVILSSVLSNAKKKLIRNSLSKLYLHDNRFNCSKSFNEYPEFISFNDNVYNENINREDDLLLLCSIKGKLNNKELKYVRYTLETPTYKNKNINQALGVTPPARNLNMRNKIKMKLKNILTF